MNEVIVAVSSAIGLTKQLVDLSEIAKSAQAKLIIADLQVQLAEVKMKLAELIEENTTLKKSLNTAISTTKEVIHKNGLYFTPDNDGPFCTACYDSKNKFVRVVELSSAFHVIAKYKCPVCEATYQ
jgi:hypothetical protein